MAQDEDLKRRLEALERENKALKQAASHGAVGNKIIRCSVGEYKGHPTITFEAGSHRLTLGVRKAAIALYCSEQLKGFVSKHNGEIQDFEIVLADESSPNSASMTVEQI